LEIDSLVKKGLFQKMNKLFVALVILFIFCCNVNAETINLSQNELRKQNPIQISIFATGRSPRQNGFVDLHLGYNIRENLTLGISVYSLYPKIISEQEIYSSTLERYEKKNTQQILYLFAHYFPFGGGFYISGVIGRYPGIIEKHTELISIDNGVLSPYQKNFFSYTRPLLSYTSTYDPRYNIGIGFGYKWIFQNGLFLGADYGLTAPTPLQKNIYIEKDIRDINRNFSLAEYLLLKKQLEWETHPGSYDNGLKLTYFVNVHFGISF
jgi:hypothetical protein